MNIQSIYKHGYVISVFFLLWIQIKLITKYKNRFTAMGIQTIIFFGSNPSLRIIDTQNISQKSFIIHIYNKNTHKEKRKKKVEYNIYIKNGK